MSESAKDNPQLDSSQTVAEAKKAYIAARFRAETESMRQAQGDDNADIVGCARGERDLKFDALLAAVVADANTAFAAHAIQCPQCHAVALAAVVAEGRQQRQEDEHDHSAALLPVDPE